MVSNLYPFNRGTTATAPKNIDHKQQEKIGTKGKPVQDVKNRYETCLSPKLAS